MAVTLGPSLEHLGSFGAVIWDCFFGGSIVWGRHLGPSLLIWGPYLGSVFGAIIWDCLFGGSIVWGQYLGPLFGVIWEHYLGPLFGTFGAFIIDLGSLFGVPIWLHDLGP